MKLIYTEYPAFASGRLSLIQAQQMTVSMMPYLLRKLCTSSRAVLDFTTRIRLTAQACLPLAKDFKFSSATQNYSFLSTPILFTFGEFVSHVPNFDSKLNEPKDIQEAAREFLKIKLWAVEHIEMNVWRAPRGLGALQKFPRHNVFSLVEAIIWGHGVFIHRNPLSCTLWSAEWIFRLNAIESGGLLSSESGIYDVYVNASVIAHERAENALPCDSDVCRREISLFHFYEKVI